MQKLSVEGFSLQAGLLHLLSSQLQEECDYALQAAHRSRLSELNLPPTASPDHHTSSSSHKTCCISSFSFAKGAKTGPPHPKAP